MADSTLATNFQERLRLNPKYFDVLFSSKNFLAITENLSRIRNISKLIWKSLSFSVKKLKKKTKNSKMSGNEDAFK